MSEKNQSQNTENLGELLKIRREKLAALQEAGSKLSRDMIKGTYFAFQQVCYLIIELIRQFYDTPRSSVSYTHLTLPTIA